MTTSTPATLQLYHYPNCQAFSDPIADPSAPPGNRRRGLKSTHMQPLTTSKGKPAFASSLCHMRHAARSSKQHATGISQQQPTQQATVSKQHAAESNMQRPATNRKWQATCNTHNCKHRAARTASNMQHTSKRQQATISKHHSAGSKGRKQQEQPTNIQQQLTTHMWNAMLDNFFDCCQAATDAVLSPAREQNAIGSADVSK